MNEEALVGRPADSPFRVAVFGHSMTVRALLSAARAGRHGQVYLLSGPPDVGKRTVARLFAQTLLCPEENADCRPCGACRVCRLVDQGGFPDLHVMEPPIKIEEVRQVQRDLHLSPTESSRRVAVLPNIEEASPGAANSLLKTLEEPPDRAVLLLTTADADAVLPTVRSRCRHLPLRALPAEATAEALTDGWGVPSDRAALLGRLSQGRLGWAVGAATDESVLSGRETWLDSLSSALDSDTAGRLASAVGMARSAEEAAEGLTVWLGWWRDLMLVSYGLESPIVNRDRLDELRETADRLSVDEIICGLRAVEDALRRLAANTNPQLTLEVLMLELPA